MTSAEMLGRQMKAGKMANFIEPLLSSGDIPISTVSDMTSEWWLEIAKRAGCGHRKPPSQQTRDLVVTKLWERALARRTHATSA